MRKLPTFPPLAWQLSTISVLVRVRVLEIMCVADNVPCKVHKTDRNVLFIATQQKTKVHRRCFKIELNRPLYETIIGKQETCPQLVDDKQRTLVTRDNYCHRGFLSAVICNHRLQSSQSSLRWQLCKVREAVGLVQMRGGRVQDSAEITGKE